MVSDRILIFRISVESLDLVNKQELKTSLKSCLSLWMFSEIYIFKKNSLINMKLLISMFEGLPFNNKEKINIAPSPPGTPLALQKLFYWISLNHTEILIFMFGSRIYLIDMKIFIFMFEIPISNNKENRNFAPPGTPLAFLKKHFFDVYGNFSI